MVRRKGVIGAIMAVVLLIGAAGTAFAAPEPADSLDDAMHFRMHRMKGNSCSPI